MTVVASPALRLTATLMREVLALTIGEYEASRSCSSRMSFLVTNIKLDSGRRQLIGCLAPSLLNLGWLRMAISTIQCLNSVPITLADS